jgi:hypothetical protein
MKHELIAQKRSRGGSPIKGMRGTSGTDVKCTCGGWKSFTNEAPPSRSQAWQKKAFAAHLRGVTLEGDIELGRAKLAKTNERLTKMLVEGEDLPSFIEGTTQAIAELGKELAADLTTLRYGPKVEDDEDDETETQAEHDAWMDAQTWAPDGI